MTFSSTFSIKREFSCQKFRSILLFLELKVIPNYSSSPPRWNSPCRLRRLKHQEVPTRVRQRGELNSASQFKPPGQQIFSTISRPQSTLIIGLLLSLVKAPLSVQRQSAYMLAVYLVTVLFLLWQDGSTAGGQ